jgi:WD40 repeat protein
LLYACDDQKDIASWAEFSADGKWLVTADAGTVIRDAATGKPVHVLPAEREIQYQALTGDGRLVLASRGGTIRVFTLADGKAVSTFREDLPVFSLAASPDGKTLLVGGHGAVSVFDLTAGKKVRRLRTPSGGIVNVLVFTPDGKRFAGADMRGNVFLWDLGTGEVVFRMQGHQESVDELVVSPDGKVLASGDRVAEVRLWSIETGQELRRLSSGGRAVGLAFAPDGKTLATASWQRTIRLWDPATGLEKQPRQGHTGPVYRVAASADGKTLATAGSDGTLRLWDAATTRLLATTTGLPYPEWQVAFVPDARTAIYAGRNALVWRNLETGKELRRVEHGESNVHGLTLSADGAVLATHAENHVILCDARTGQRLDDFVPATRYLRGLALSPDARFLALFDDKGGLIVRDVGARQELWRVPLGEVSRVAHIAFAPDGRSLVCAVVGGRLSWLETRTGKIRTSCTITSEKGVSSLAFSADGRLVAAGDFDGAVHVWDLASAKGPVRLPGHPGGTYGVAFVGGGHTLATAGGDMTALLWDAPAAALPGRTEADLRKLLVGLENADDYAALLSGCLASPEQAVPLLRGLFRPADVEPKRVAAWIADLDDESFEVRRKAEEELGRRVQLIEPSLRRALAANPSLEKKRRLEELLSKVNGEATEALLPSLRAIEILERLGTPEARRILGELAEGGVAAPLSREAGAAVERLRRRP